MRTKSSLKSKTRSKNKLPIVPDPRSYDKRKYFPTAGGGRRSPPSRRHSPYHTAKPYSGRSSVQERRTGEQRTSSTYTNDIDEILKGLHDHQTANKKIVHRSSVTGSQRSSLLDVRAQQPIVTPAASATNTPAKPVVKPERRENRAFERPPTGNVSSRSRTDSPDNSLSTADRAFETYFKNQYDYSRDYSRNEGEKRGTSWNQPQIQPSGTIEIPKKTSVSEMVRTVAPKSPETPQKIIARGYSSKSSSNNRSSSRQPEIEPTSDLDRDNPDRFSPFSETSDTVSEREGHYTFVQNDSPKIDSESSGCSIEPVTPLPTQVPTKFKSSPAPAAFRNSQAVNSSKHSSVSNSLSKESSAIVVVGANTPSKQASSLKGPKRGDVQKRVKRASFAETAPPLPAPRNAKSVKDYVSFAKDGSLITTYEYPSEQQLIKEEAERLARKKMEVEELIRKCEAQLALSNTRLVGGNADMFSHGDKTLII